MFLGKIYIDKFGIEELFFYEMKGQIVKKKIFKIIRVVVIVFLVVYIVIGLLQNDLTVSKYAYTGTRLPKEFDGFTIVLISDLHHNNFGNNQSELIEEIEKANPDMIALTGDIVDENHKSLESVENLLAGVVSLAPTYYVTGNHELLEDAVTQYGDLKEMLDSYGVVQLENEGVEVKQGDASINIYGVGFADEYVENILPYANEGEFDILLYHSSNVFGKINKYGYDIVLSGHLHGGGIRLPFVGGVINNDGSLFPKYDAGVFVENESTLFVSRGLGDSVVPRFYNPPELVVITLESEN